MQLASQLKSEAWKHDIPSLDEVAAKAIAYLVFALPCPLRGLKGCVFMFGADGCWQGKHKKRNLYSYQKNTRGLQG